MIAYATPEGFSEWAAGAVETPSDIAVRLRESSVRVRRATSMAVYVADENGHPTNTAYLDAMREATMTDALVRVQSGLRPGASSGPLIVASKSIPGASISYAGANEQAAANAVLSANTVAPMAALILQNAGLIGGQPVRI